MACGETAACSTEEEAGEEGTNQEEKREREARAAVAKLRGSPLVHRWERDGVDLVVYAKDSLSKIPGFTRGHHVQS